MSQVHAGYEFPAEHVRSLDPRKLGAALTPRSEFVSTEPDEVV
jgi:hypothetical protein